MKTNLGADGKERPRHVARAKPEPAPRPARTRKVRPALLALLLAAGWRWRDAIISWLNR